MKRRLPLTLLGILPLLAPMTGCSSLGSGRATTYCELDPYEADPLEDGVGFGVKILGRRHPELPVERANSHEHVILRLFLRRDLLSLSS